MGSGAWARLSALGGSLDIGPDPARVDGVTRVGPRRGNPCPLPGDEGTWCPRSKVSVVGTRAADAEAMDFAHDLAADLCAAGCVVVSGGARGIDAAAHEGALSVGGATVAERAP